MTVLSAEMYDALRSIGIDEAHARAVAAATSIQNDQMRDLREHMDRGFHEIELRLKDQELRAEGRFDKVDGRFTLVFWQLNALTGMVVALLLRLLLVH